MQVSLLSYIWRSYFFNVYNILWQSKSHQSVCPWSEIVIQGILSLPWCNDAKTVCTLPPKKVWYNCSCNRESSLAYMMNIAPQPGVWTHISTITLAYSVEQLWHHWSISTDLRAKKQRNINHMPKSKQAETKWIQVSTDSLNLIFMDVNYELFTSALSNIHHHPLLLSEHNQHRRKCLTLRWKLAFVRIHHANPGVYCCCSS